MPPCDSRLLTRRINEGIVSLPGPIKDQALGSATLDIPPEMRDLGVDTAMLGPTPSESHLFSVQAVRTLLQFFARFPNHWNDFRGVVTLPFDRLAELFFLSATRDEQRRIASEAEAALRNQRELDPETRALIRQHHQMAQQQSVDLRQGNPFSEIFTALYEDADLESDYDMEMAGGAAEFAAESGGVEEIHLAVLALLMARDARLRADWADSVSALAAH